MTGEVFVRMAWDPAPNVKGDAAAAALARGRGRIAGLLADVGSEAAADLAASGGVGPKTTADAASALACVGGAATPAALLAVPAHAQALLDSGVAAPRAAFFAAHTLIGLRQPRSVLRPCSSSTLRLTMHLLQRLRQRLTPSPLQWSSPLPAPLTNPAPTPTPAPRTPLRARSASLTLQRCEFGAARARAAEAAAAASAAAAHRAAEAATLCAFCTGADGGAANVLGALGRPRFRLAHLESVGTGEGAAGAVVAGAGGAGTPWCCSCDIL